MGLFGLSEADVTATLELTAPDLSWFVQSDRSTAGFRVFIAIGNPRVFPRAAEPVPAAAMATARKAWDEADRLHSFKGAAHRGLVVNIRADDGHTYGVGVQGNDFESDSGIRIY